MTTLRCNRRDCYCIANICFNARVMPSKEGKRRDFADQKLAKLKNRCDLKIYSLSIELMLSAALIHPTFSGLCSTVPRASKPCKRLFNESMDDSGSRSCSAPSVARDETGARSAAVKRLAVGINIDVAPSLHCQVPWIQV